MTLAALELNDVGLVLRWQEGETILGPPPIPGCAVLHDGAILTGHAAAERSRLLPKNVHDRFWAELGTAPLPPPFPSDLSAADLVHEQLDRTRRDAGVALRSLLVAVPGSFTPAQLGLLLGIARALELPIRGLVDAAVAAASSTASGARCLHVDVELHRSVVTELLVGDEVGRGRVLVETELGLARMRDAWARHVAALFVERTRLDPLGTARSEQQLYGRLPELARRLQDESSRTLELEINGEPLSVEVEAAGLTGVCAKEVRALLESATELLKPAGHVQVLLSERAASVPGLRDALRRATGSEPEPLPHDAAARAALRGRERIESSDHELPFIARLPRIRSEAGSGSPSD